MTTITTEITELSTPPSRDDPVNFVPRADTLFTSLPTLVTEINAVSTEMNIVSGEVSANASSASASAIAASAAVVQAEQAVLAASAVSGATKWITGTDYSEGAVTWSPINGQNYRRKAPGGVSSTDPSADATGWYSLISLQGLITSEISTTTAAVSGRHYVFTASCELTLPSSATLGDVIEFTNISGTLTCTVNPNGLKIRGNSETMTVDSLTANTTLTYTGVTNGWV